MSDCKAIENFCGSGCQTVKQHSIGIFGTNFTDGFKFSEDAKEKTKVKPLFINEAVDAIVKINNYGKLGDNVFTEEEIKLLEKVAQKEKIGIAEFNSLLTILKNENKKVNSKSRLLSSCIDNLINIINNYNLPENRCNECNSSCQSQSCGESCNECAVPYNCLSQTCGLCESHEGCLGCEYCGQPNQPNLAAQGCTGGQCTATGQQT